MPVTCFLLFNVGDFCGRLAASFVQWVGTWNPCATLIIRWTSKWIDQRLLILNQFEPSWTCIKHVCACLLVYVLVVMQCFQVTFHGISNKLHVFPCIHTRLYIFFANHYLVSLFFFFFFSLIKMVYYFHSSASWELYSFLCFSFVMHRQGNILMPFFRKITSPFCSWCCLPSRTVTWGVCAWCTDHRK